MNAQPQGADFALALYDAACVSHQRKDWRQACHALAATLKAELLRSAATPMPANDLPAPAKPAAKAAKGPKAAAAPLAFTMTAESLSKALRLLCRITDRRGTIPILAHVLIVASGDTLDMTATDLDRELTLTVEAPGVGEWQATADAHALAKLLGKAKGPVSLAGEVTDHRRGAQNDESKPFCTRIMVGGAVNATLAGLPPADFPRVKADTLKGLHKVAVTPAQLVDGFSFARPAISTEETRYYLNGAYVHQVIEDGRRRVRIVATDGSRLAVSGHDLPRKGAPGMPPAIVPRSAVLDMLALLAGQPAMQLELATKALRLTCGAAVYLSKCIDGSFPDYQRVIPADGGTRVTFDAGELDAALAKVSAVSQDKSRSVRMALDNGACTLTCRNMEGGSASETVSCNYSEPLPREVSFNAGFLRDALTQLGAVGVKVLIGSPNDPARLESADKGADGRLVVVMPLRV